jgi:hypothetical protein
LIIVYIKQISEDKTYSIYVLLVKLPIGIKQNIGALTERLNALQKRILMLISTNAIQRYEYFIQTYPNITQRVPQHMIASYIGVNPETLSAAKAKHLKKNS